MHDAATRGPYLALSKAWWSCYWFILFKSLSVAYIRKHISCICTVYANVDVWFWP